MSATSVSSKASGTHPPPTSSKPKYLNVINAVPEESQADLFDFPPLPGTRRQLSATTHNPSESPPARRAKAVGKLRKVSSRSKKLEATNESLLPGSLPRLVDVPGPSCKPVAINGGTRSTPKRVRVSDGESTDIILVHGLEGDPFLSSGNSEWVDEEGSNVWIRDLFLERLSNARLYVYIYETGPLKEKFGEDLNLQIRDHSECLMNELYRELKSDQTSISLIGNGFGGLIAKQALVYAGRRDISLDTVGNSGQPAESTRPISPSNNLALPSDCCKFLRDNLSGIVFLGTPHRGWQTLNGAMYYTRASPPQTNVPPLLELPPLPSVAPYAPYADHFAHLSDRSIIWGNGPRGPVQYGMSVNQAMNPYKAPAADFEGQGDKLREGSMPVSLGGPDQALPVAMKHMLKEGDDIGSNDQRSNSWQRDSTETSGSPEKTLDDLFKEQHELMDHLKLLTSKLKYAIRCSSWDPDHKAESDFLQGLAWKFSEVCNCNSYNILTVFAALPSKLRKNAVNRQSAVLGIPRETILALKVVHENLTRHDCRDSTDEYLQLEKAILELIKSSNKSKEALVSGKVARSPAKQKTNTGLSNRGLSDVRKSERDLIEKHFPPEVDLPVEALTVVLTQSTGFPGLNFPKFCEDYGYLHNLDNLVKILEENTDLTYTKTQSDSGIETDSNTYDENEEQEVTINGGFMWMHVPGNDRSWVKDILEKVHFNRNPGLPLDILHDDFWKYKEQLHKYSNSFSPAFMEPSCNVSFVDGKPQFAIYLPYLHWCDDKYQKEQAKALEAFRSSSKGLKDEYALSKMDPSKRLRSAALTDTGDLRHHPRRTLDQYYYRNGTDTRMRDDDQIVSHPDKDKLLMVDQLWIFVTSTDTIFTFFPRNDPTKHPQRTDASLADLKKSLDDEISKCTEDHRCRYNAYEMAARCLYHAVTVLLAQRIQSEFNVMNIFQDVIAETKEKAVQSLNTFVRDQDTDIPISITTELNILLKASDLEDELSILAYLFRQQKKVMQSFKKLLHFNDLDRDQPTYSNSSSEFIYARHIVDKALQRLEDYREDLKQRQEEAGSTRALLLSTLDLKQKKANLEEAKRTLEMAKASGEQGRAMMIFTVFTVVFLPLSFFTSMYGMNIKEWSGADTNVSGKTVAIYTGSISVAVILMALFVAFGVVRLKRVYERVRRGFRASNLRAPRRRDEDEEGYDLISL